MHSWFKPPTPTPLCQPPLSQTGFISRQHAPEFYILLNNVLISCVVTVVGGKTRSRWHRARHNVDSLNSQRGYLLLIFMSLLLLSSEFHSPHLGLSLKAPWWSLKSKQCVFRRVGGGVVMLLLCGPGQTPLRVASKGVCC